MQFGMRKTSVFTCIKIAKSSDMFLTFLGQLTFDLFHRLVKIVPVAPVSLE